MNIEIVNKRAVIDRKFISDKIYRDEYIKHIGYGVSGEYDTKTGKGKIRSFRDRCKQLEAEGYKNCKFPNGGDDDVLVIDHDAKEFGFFENYSPSGNNLKTSKTLTELWKNHI